MFCFLVFIFSPTTMKSDFSAPALTVHQLPMQIAQHVHEVLTGLLWQDLPSESSLIVAAAKTHTHTQR